MHPGPLIDQNECPFKLSHAFGVDAKVGLQRKINLDTRWDVNEGPSRPDRGIQGGKLVVCGRDHGSEMLSKQVRMFAQCSVGVGENHSFFGQVLLERSIDHFTLKLSFHTGKEFFLRFRNAKPIEGLFNLIGDIIPGFALRFGRFQIIVDVLKIKIDCPTPGWCRFGLK